jgi:N-acetylmuramoyl-L-alanine amidase
LPVGPAASVQPVDPNHIAPPAPRALPASKGVVVLDPGHGRGDPGATHYLPDGSRRWDVTEADSNMLNARLIKAELVAMGYEVYLTREDGEAGPGGPLPLQFIASDLYWRVALAKSVDADVYLAIHGNGATVHSISGPETWYCGKHEEGAANEQLAMMVQRAMMDALHEYGYFPPDRGIKEDAEAHHSGDFCQFVVTRETPVPAALLEFLFLTNDDDARVLVDPKAHEILARHVAHAIDAFLAERTGR